MALTSISIELALDREDNAVWFKIAREGEEDVEFGIPAVHAFNLGEALIQAVMELGFEGDPSSDPKVAN